VTDQTSTFKTVMRGYDPAEVDRRLEELTAAVTSLTQQRDGLASRVQELHEASSGSPEPPGFEHLGARVGQILSLAETEAIDLRDRARDEADARAALVHQAAGQARKEADVYAARVRGEAESAAGRIEEEARKAADEHRDSAERDASVRLQEAEAVYEEQRARAAKAAADFETTLAGRRKAAEEEFTQKMAQSQARLDEANERAERIRTDAEHARAEASRDASRLIDDARHEAARIISDAKATAERVRADSDRELSAASQRRDSINAQLANVRQMLATLTGTAAMPLAAFGADDDDHEGQAGEPEQAGEPAGPAATDDASADPHEADVSDEADEADEADQSDEADEADGDDAHAGETEASAKAREESLAETSG
jgi:DivIVA domain-containing protein